MLRFFSVFFCVLLFSCGEYQKVLSKGTVAQKYKMAIDMYDAKKYAKAIRLFEVVIPSYSGKPQMERIQYMVAQAHFNLKDYESAAYYFKRFAGNYPNSSKREEASFLSCKSYFLSTPKYSVDQTQTHTAIEALQLYLIENPDSNKLDSVNDMIADLEKKLQKKRFEIAKQYYRIKDYKAATAAFDGFMTDFLASDYKQDALYYKFLSSYQLAINSALTKKLQRVKNAIENFEKLKKNFPNSPYLLKLKKEINQLKKY